MKFVILLSVVCLIGGVLAKPALTKQKRNILPGDPRYGTDYHHKHHHQHPQESNEIEISRALGGYVGTYASPERNVHPNNFQAPHPVYGPPSYSPGQPIHHHESAQQNLQQAVQPIQQYIPAPSASVSNFKPSESVETISNGYLSPVVQPTQASVVYQQPQVFQEQEQHPIASQNNGYLAPAATAAQAPVVHYSPSAPVYTQQASHHQVQPANGYLGPVIEKAEQQLAQRPVDSYGAPIFQRQQPAAQQQVFVVKSQAPVQQQSGQTFNHAKTVQPAPVQYQAKVIHSAPVQSQVHVHSQNHEQHQAVQTAKNIQEQVTHVYQAPQSVVRHQVSQAQPAVSRQIIYQSEPQTYSSGHVANGFENLGNLNSEGFSYQLPVATAPQVYARNLGNSGFDYQQDNNANVYRNDFTSDQHNFQQPQTYQIQIRKQASYPGQNEQVGASRTFVHHAPQVIQQQPELSSFVSSPVRQVTAHHEASQVAPNDAISYPDDQLESVRVESIDNRQVQSSGHQEQTQLIGSNGGYVY